MRHYQGETSLFEGHVYQSKNRYYDLGPSKTTVTVDHDGESRAPTKVPWKSTTFQKKWWFIFDYDKPYYEKWWFVNQPMKTGGWTSTGRLLSHLFRGWGRTMVIGSPSNFSCPSFCHPFWNILVCDNLGLSRAQSSDLLTISILRNRNFTIHIAQLTIG